MNRNLKRILILIRDIVLTIMMIIWFLAIATIFIEAYTIIGFALYFTYTIIKDCFLLDLVLIILIITKVFEIKMFGGK